MKKAPKPKRKARPKTTKFDHVECKDLIVRDTAGNIRLHVGNMYTVAPFYVLIIILMIRPYGLFGTENIERM